MTEELDMNTNRSNNIDEAIDASEPEPPEPPEHLEPPKNTDSLEPTVTITIDDGVEGVNADWLIEHANQALQCIDKVQSSIAIRVVDDETMSELHLNHAGIPSTTDVLTFDHGSSDYGIHADIAICGDVAKRSASDRNHELNAELLLYVIHGMLHCVGHDDQNENDHKQIHAEEDRILTAIGVGPVWSRFT